MAACPVVLAVPSRSSRRPIVVSRRRIEANRRKGLMRESSSSELLSSTREWTTS